MSIPYEAVIRRFTEREPADILAWLYLEYSTLDALSLDQFRTAVRGAESCIEAATAEDTRRLRGSYGL